MVFASADLGCGSDEVGGLFYVGNSMSVRVVCGRVERCGVGCASWVICTNLKVCC